MGNDEEEKEDDKYDGTVETVDEEKNNKKRSVLFQSEIRFVLSIFVLGSMNIQFRNRNVIEPCNPPNFSHIVYLSAMFTMFTQSRLGLIW